MGTDTPSGGLFKNTANFKFEPAKKQFEIANMLEMLHTLTPPQRPHFASLASPKGSFRGGVIFECWFSFGSFFWDHFYFHLRKQNRPSD